MNSFNGIPLLVVPDTYRTLAKDVPVTQEFRDEINAWMRTFFKPKNVLEDGQIIQPGGPTRPLYMNPRTYETVKKAMSE